MLVMASARVIAGSAMLGRLEVDRVVTGILRVGEERRGAPTGKGEECETPE